MQQAQAGVLHTLDKLDLVATSHGQAAWPWAYRLSGDILLIDRAQARLLATSLVIALVALGVGAAAAWLLWRRRFSAAFFFLATAVLALLAAPWPPAHIVWVQANPTSFHQSPTGFDADSIQRGRSLFAQHCIACHGARGLGDGPLADAQPVSPPNLAGPLLWRRADGDVFWRVLHGVQDRHGLPSMPGFRQVLSDTDAWAVIDFMKAQGAGENLRISGRWSNPVRLPNFVLRCGRQPEEQVSAWQHQRVRVVAVDGKEASHGGAGRLVQAPAALLEDPRLNTVWLMRDQDQTALPAGPGIPDCIARSTAAWDALATLSGVDADAFGGTQLLSDRDGWLRARGEPGKQGWSDADLLCRVDTGKPVGQATAGDGLGRLIASMDAEPIRFIKGGFVH
ncbi:cytochrome c [Pigmentiphaga aceris]|uniref:Cytochrome c n=2 Tax=Pigmentiphaga aceris TaxID=1940612 RepID=A0A5C0B5P4_9BURK|nr:cytochrome c [Pigmentiphaga aceris]